MPLEVVASLTEGLVALRAVERRVIWACDWGDVVNHGSRHWEAQPFALTILGGWG